MLEILRSPWHWSVAGLIIGLTVPALLLIGNKTFGLSSNLRHICAACFPANISFFKYDWKKEIWNFFFVGGMIVGAFLATHFLTNPDAILIHPTLIQELGKYGIKANESLVPTEIFSFSALFTLRGFTFMVVGGFLVGFGTRYAGGCTSGHAITGLSNLQLPSLIATICFMIGGFFATYFILPLILSL